MWSDATLDFLIDFVTQQRWGVAMLVIFANPQLVNNLVTVASNHAATLISALHDMAHTQTQYVASHSCSTFRIA